jgi:PAS domain S-box-containing protein
VRDALPELACQGFFEILDGVYASGEPFVGRQMPITLQRPGEPARSLYFDFVYQPITNSQGQVIGIFGGGHDVTALKHAEIALRHSEERFSTALMIAELGTFDWNLRDDTVTASERTRVIFGFGEGEGEGGQAEDYFSRIVPDDVERVRAEIETTLQGSGRLDTQYRIRLPDGSIRHVASLSQLYRDAQKQPEREVGVFEDITEQKRWEEHQMLLINELNHRVKNTLATVQSIASQTLRNTETAAQAKSAIEGRLLALSRAHDVLTRENWEGADLYEIAEQAVAPYSSPGENRLHLSGPKVRLLPRMALALAMALQELVTNAVKYGALSNATGQITITWKVEQGEPSSLELRWAESGGPAVRTPTRRGFGSRLIERSLAQDLGGHVQIAFAGQG